MKKQYQEEKTCACCGKTMYVLHPSRWAYKKKKGKETYTWYCSWKCMRKDETVERRLTQENYDKAVEIAIRGEDPLAYLKKNGAKNPSATWCYIKKKLATSDPDKLAKVPEKVGTVINEKGQAVPVVRPLKKGGTQKNRKAAEADPGGGCGETAGDGSGSHDQGGTRESKQTNKNDRENYRLGGKRNKKQT